MIEDLCGGCNREFDPAALVECERKPTSFTDRNSKWMLCAECRLELGIATPNEESGKRNEESKTEDET